MGLGSWEDHFFSLYEAARDGHISSEDIVECIDRDYREGNDGRGALTLMIQALLSDCRANTEPA